MAQAQLYQPTRPATRKPDAARILQSYFHICETQGKHHAFRTTAQIYGISHMTVRRIVERHEAALQAADASPELEYVAPPGGYDPPIMPIVDIAAFTEPSQTDAAPCESPSLHNGPFFEALPQDTTNHTPEDSHPEPSQIHMVELESSPPTLVEPSQIHKVVGESLTPALVEPSYVAPARVVRERVVLRAPQQRPRRNAWPATLTLDHIWGPELGVLLVVLVILCVYWL